MATPVDSVSTIPRQHLVFLRGLRGIAALYVLLQHACNVLLVTIKNGYNDSTQPATLWFVGQAFHTFFAHAHYAVVTLLVISGFCMMMPLAKSGTKSEFDPCKFIRRRARRILPPYYVALAFSLAVCAVPGLDSPSGFAYDFHLPAFTIEAILGHALLIHNWIPEIAGKINAPMWSVAFEWQIYFLFAWILVPLSRRFGILAAIVASAFASVTPLLGEVLLAIPPVNGSWLILAFALGMCAAEICFRDDAMTQSLLMRPFWGRTAFYLGWLILLTLLVQRASFESHAFLWVVQIHANTLEAPFDLLVALWAAALIIHCFKTMHFTHESSFTRRILESRPATTVGLFAYSLYLIHSPVLILTDFVVRSMFQTAILASAVYSLIALPIALAFAHAFHALVERRFQSSQSTTHSQLEATRSVLPPLREKPLIG